MAEVVCIQGLRGFGPVSGLRFRVWVRFQCKPPLSNYFLQILTRLEKGVASR